MRRTVRRGSFVESFVWGSPLQTLLAGRRRPFGVARAWLSGAVCLAVALWFCGPAWAETELQPEDPASFFVEPGKVAVLRFRVRGGRPSDGLRYVVRDYTGRQTDAGEAAWTDDGTAEVRLRLPVGYYDLDFSSVGQRFGVASLPRFEGRRDPFFAVDAASSWLVKDDRVREALAANLRRCGIGMARERLRWAEISPSPGVWHWDAAHRNERLRRTYAAHDVAVLEMFHDAPPWLGLTARYPSDLVRTARQWQQIARRWSHLWGALEVWNEPDIFFGGNLPADQYVAVVRAVAAGARRASPKTPIVGGVFAHYDPTYLETAANNGLLELVDVVSFHTYAHAPQVEGLVARYRDWLVAHGHPNKPLWITECGRPWKRGPDRPPVDQDAASALDIVAKVVEARACGVERHFPFVYPFYEERENNFGLMGRQATPLRSMAAYAQAVRVLAHTEYLGDLVLPTSAVQRARVFASGSQAVAVLYTGRVAPNGQVALPVQPLRAEGADGRALTVNASGAVPVPDGLTYVWLDRRRLTGHLRTDTNAKRLWRLGRSRSSGQPARRPTSTDHAAPARQVVLRLDFDGQSLRPNSHGYQVAAEAVSRLRLPVQAFNLDDRPHRLTLTLPADVTLVEGQRRQSCSLPPNSSAGVAWTVDVRRLLKAGREGAVSFRVAVDCDGRPTTPLVFRLSLSGQQ